MQTFRFIVTGKKWHKIFDNEGQARSGRDRREDSKSYANSELYADRFQMGEVRCKTFENHKQEDFMYKIMQRSHR